MMRSTVLKKWVLSALFLALGLVLPFLTGQIPQVGSMLLPMHIPVLLCGLICGAPYGALIGLILPPLRFVLFGMPPIFPVGFAMAFELMTYGLVIGLIYSRLPKHKIQSVYGAMIPAMLCGRIVWGVVCALTSGAAQAPFTWQAFLSGAVLTAIPGIVIQLILIPLVIAALEQAKLIPLNSQPG